MCDLDLCPLEQKLLLCTCMKTQNVFNKVKVSTLTLSFAAALALSACNSPMQFADAGKTVGLSSPVEELEPITPEDPVVEPPVVVDPVTPEDPIGEVDDPVIDPPVIEDPVIEPPVVVDPPVVEPVDPKVEIFQQAYKGGKVDVLFVVDNSPSMQKEQKKLSERLKAFMSGLDKTDWQIAFTTTDVSDGAHGLKGSLMDLAGHAGQKVLTKSFADAETVFLKTVQRSEIASSDEQPLKASILAMQKSATENAVFFRNDADLAIIVLSDEDEMSLGKNKKATKPQDVVNAFDSIFGSSKKLAVYGIVIQPDDVACYKDQKGSGNFQNASYGTFVTELARITEGFTGSICANDYTGHLKAIGNSVRLLTDFFILKQSPAPGTVSVQLSPAQNIPWVIEGNKLMFETAPEDGTVIQVTYD